VANELAQNHRGSIAPVHPSILNETTDEELHNFFPFDPYRLPKSSSYIQSIYKEWSSVAFGEGDDERDEGDEGDDEYDGDWHHQNDISKEHHPDLPIIQSREEDDVWLGISFEAMSISPAPPVLPISPGL
jgi:RNA polymerase I-specific transcription initiation factor RRN3